MKPFRGRRPPSLPAALLPALLLTAVLGSGAVASAQSRTSPVLNMVVTTPGR